MFDQPIASAWARSKRILLAGCGGGYDVFGAVPLLLDLVDAKKQVHLASLSFSHLNALAGAVSEPGVPNLYEVPAAAATTDAYCPEAWLADWFHVRLGRAQPIWAFDRTGVMPMLAAYRHLVKKLGIDCVVLVDGGIDSLLRGDESSLGTPVEDLTSLAAVAALDVPVKVLTCVGLGAETRDGISHSQVLERILDLSRSHAWLGAAPLVHGTRVAALYADAVSHAFSHQREKRRSHVHKMVKAAVAGESGSRGEDVWLSPLLNLYWFFALDKVAETHLFLPRLYDTVTRDDVDLRIEAARRAIAARPRERIPI